MRTFQLDVAFNTMTAIENVRVAAYFGRSERQIPGLLFDTFSYAKAFEALSIVGLQRKAHEVVGNLPVLDRKLIMLAGALATEPKILLMDEPVGGLTPPEIEIFEKTLRVVLQSNCTLVVIEHVMSFLLRIASKMLIMHQGRIIFDGVKEQMLNDSQVVEVYLGKTAASLLRKSIHGPPERVMDQLLIDNLVSGYGRSNVIEDVSIAVPKGSVVALVGPNGHGKTTLLKTISGLVSATAGRISFLGEDITYLRPERIAQMGIAHVPQGDLLFPLMTVRENLLLGAFHEPSEAALTTRMHKVFELFPKLPSLLDQTAASLSGGERRMVGTR